MPNELSLETYFSLPTLTPPQPGELGREFEAIPGVHFSAGLHPAFHGHFLAFVIGGSSQDTGPAKAAGEAAERAVQTAHVEVEAEVRRLPEFEAVGVTAERLAAGQAELKACEQKVADAKSSFDTTLAAGEDPRGLRPGLSAAEIELGDVRRWVDQLRAIHYSATKAVDAIRDRLFKARCSAEVAAAKDRRMKLKNEVEATMPRLVEELLIVTELEAVFGR